MIKPLLTVAAIGVAGGVLPLNVLVLPALGMLVMMGLDKIRDQLRVERMKNSVVLAAPAG